MTTGFAAVCCWCDAWADVQSDACGQAVWLITDTVVLWQVWRPADCARVIVGSPADCAREPN